MNFKEFLNEEKGSIKVGDILKGVEGIIKGKEGKVISINKDMLQVDFGNGDKYGITVSRVKDGKIFDKPINESLPTEKRMSDIGTLIDRLTKLLSSDSILAKSIIKELGSGYKKDFDEMTDHIFEIQDIWNQINMDVSNSK